MPTWTLRPLTLTLVLTIGLSTPIHAQEATDYGPPNGTLVIVGGGSMNGTGIVERFIELGGGAEEGRFVIVPTAGGNYDGEGNVRVYDEEAVLASWRDRGIKTVSMLQTHDRAVADTEEFVAELEQATAVWFNGGRQWNIVDSYAGTRTYAEFHKVLERGGVIGGSSAGATIQGAYLVRGDTKGPAIVMTAEENHQAGFEFLRRSAIDQHINTRGRWDDIIPVIEQQPELLGIGLSEGTAIIVTGDTFEVMGKWMVAVHDNTRAYQPWEKPYFVLAPGDFYDMKARRVVPPPPLVEHIEVVVAERILETYVGEYALSSALSMVVTLERGGLFVQPNGQGKLPIFPESETRFFLKAIDAQISFTRDDSGAVSGIVLHQSGRSQAAPRVR